MQLSSTQRFRLRHQRQTGTFVALAPCQRRFTSLQLIFVAASTPRPFAHTRVPLQLTFLTALTHIPIVSKKNHFEIERDRETKDSGRGKKAMRARHTRKSERGRRRHVNTMLARGEVDGVWIISEFCATSKRIGKTNKAKRKPKHGQGGEGGTPRTHKRSFEQTQPENTAW